MSLQNYICSVITCKRVTFFFFRFVSVKSACMSVSAAHVCVCWRKAESLKAGRLCLSSFMTLSTYKNSRSLVFLGFSTGTDLAAPILKTCPILPLACLLITPLPSTSVGLTQDTELFMGKWGWICVILHGMHHQLVSLGLNRLPLRLQVWLDC